MYNVKARAQAYPSICPKPERNNLFGVFLRAKGLTISNFKKAEIIKTSCLVTQFVYLLRNLPGRAAIHNSPILHQNIKWELFHCDYVKESKLHSLNVKPRWNRQEVVFHLNCQTLLTILAKEVCEILDIQFLTEKESEKNQFSQKYL